MSDRYLWIQTSSGLASRMRAVVGALAYCKATGRRLIVDWPYEERSETLGCFPAKFHDLWSNSEIEATDCKQRFPGLRPDNTHLLSPDVDQLKVRTCHIEPFMPWIPEQKPGVIANHLSPSLAVAEHIDSVMPLLLNEGSCFVGVNIRHALKQPSVASVDWFIDRMRTFPDHVQFFASLDDKDVSEQLLATFPDRVLELNKTYVYDRDGTIKTCADLYLLASCDYMVGSNYSSYSQMAAFLRGAQYIGPHDKPERGLECSGYEDLWNPPQHGETPAVFSGLDVPTEMIVVSQADVGRVEDVLPLEGTP